MTFELSEKIIIEEQIPKDVELLADMENDLGTKDMDCVQYSAERKEICFTPRYYLDYSAYDEGIAIQNGVYCAVERIVILIDRIIQKEFEIYQICCSECKCEENMLPI